MVKYFFLLFLPFLVVACEKEDIIDNSWKEKNIEYLDSIASIAKSNPNNWKILLNYKLGVEGFVRFHGVMILRLF